MTETVLLLIRSLRAAAGSLVAAGFSTARLSTTGFSTPARAFLRAALEARATFLRRAVWVWAASRDGALRWVAIRGCAGAACFLATGASGLVAGAAWARNSAPPKPIMSAAHGITQPR